MTYSFCEKDLIKSPEKYQFTAFEGEKFLKSYLKLRNSILNDISLKTSSKNNFSTIINNLIKNKNSNNKQGNLEELFLRIIGEKENGNHKSDNIIDIFLKKYEVKKRLATHYDENFLEKKSNYYHLRNYVLLNVLLMIRFSETKNIRFLNTMLKINDMLISKITSINNKTDLEIFKNLLKNEIKFVKELCKLKGVNIT